MLKAKNQKRVLFSRTLTLLLMGVLSVATILYGGFALHSHRAFAATNSTINFQARLESAGGAIAPDGYYNIQFKLYSASSGGSALWTESYYDSNGVTAGNDNRVQTINGYVTVNLASQTAFPSTINWDQELYLTMNVGGTTQTATPTYDGEMSPRLRLTGVPYAFRAGQLAQFNATSGFTSTLSLLQPTVGDQLFQVADQAAAGTYTLCVQGAAVANGGCAPTTGGTGYIQNGTSLQTSSNFHISGTGVADTALQAPAIDVASAGTLSVGTSTATALTLGKTGVTTTSAGSLTVGSSAGSGAVLTNNGAHVNTTLVLGNFPSGGSLGSAATTVDIYASVSVAQTSNNQTISLPTPTASTAYGRMLYISNIGTTLFTLQSTPLKPGATATLMWSNTNGGASWQYAGADGSSILNQNTTTQTADFSISGGGTAGSFSSNTFSSTGNLALQAASGSSVTISPGAGGGGSGTLNLAVNAATLNIGNNSNNARTIGIGNTAGSQTQTVTIGNNASASASSTSTVQGSNGVLLQTNGSSAGVVARSVTNSTAAFVVQNASNSPIFNVDTTTSKVSAAGVFEAATSLQAPLLDTASAVALNIGTSNATVINLNENASVATGKTLTVVAGATTLTGASSGDALTVSNSTSSGSIFVANDNTTAVATIADGGSVLFQNSANSSAAFQVQNAAGSHIITANTSTGNVILGRANGASGLNSTLLFSNATNSNQIGIKIADGTAAYTLTLPSVAPNTGECLKAGAVTATSLVFSSCGGGGGVTLQGSTPGTPDTGNINISGVAIAGTSMLTPLLDTASAVALDIGTTNATVINLNENTTIASGKTLTANGAVQITTTAPNTSMGAALGIGATLTSTTNPQAGSYISSTVTPGSASTQYYAGVLSKLVSSSANASGASLYGGYFDSDYSGTNFTGTNAGLQGIGIFSGSGTMANAWGVAGRVHNNSTGTITNASALRLLNPLNASGTITNSYGLYIDNMTNGATDYGLYIQGADNYALYVNSGVSHFSGAVSAAGSGTGLAVANSATIGGALAVTGIISGATSLRTPLIDTASAVALDIGTTNATVINLNEDTTVATGKTFSVQGGTSTLTGNSSTGDALVISNSTSTGGILIAKDNTTTVASIANGGAASFQNSTDSTTAFQIQNSAGASLFVADATNLAIKIGGGDVSANTSPAILVLDHSTSASDPTGIDGAMYFNESTDTFRCYAQGVWGYCGGPPSAAYGYHLEEDFYGDNTTSGDIGAEGWLKTATGTQAGTRKAASDSANRPGVIEIGTGSTATGKAAMYLGDLTTDGLYLAGGERVEIGMNVPILSTAGEEFISRTGLCDSDTADCTDGLYFEYDRLSSTNWRIVAASNGTRTKTNTSTAVAAATWYNMKIVVNSNATSVEYFINGTSVGTITTDIPTGSSRRMNPLHQISKSAGTTARFVRLDYFDFQNSFAGLR